MDLQGAVDPSEVPGLINASTAVVLSSDHEGLPMIVLEASQLGRPVVGTDVGGMREAVASGITGELVPREDPGTLAEAILKTISNPTHAESLGAAAVAHIDRLFSLRACADQYEALYHDVLAQSQGEEKSA